jgi:hypothetical protein
MPQFIPYQTAAATHEFEFLIKDVGSALILDVADGWAGAETIPLYYIGDDGVRVTPVLDSSGAAVALSKTMVEYPITHACKIRLVKPITVASVGVNLFGN